MGAAVKPTRSGARVAIGTGRKRKTASPIDKAKGYEITWQHVSPLFEAARPYTDITFLYIVGEANDGPLKIGYSKDPISRLRTMQTGNPRRLKIEYVLVGSMHTEKLLHELWEPHAIYSARTNGRVDAAPGTEWFNPDIRAQLFPIIQDAVTRQTEHLRTADGDITSDDMERIVRDAHWDDETFIPPHRDPARLLGGGIIGRRSRI